jgi:hypothetical protein
MNYVGQYSSMYIYYTLGIQIADFFFLEEWKWMVM